VLCVQLSFPAVMQATTCMEPSSAGLASSTRTFRHTTISQLVQCALVAVMRHEFCVCFHKCLCRILHLGTIHAVLPLLPQLQRLPPPRSEIQRATVWLRLCTAPMAQRRLRMSRMRTFLGCPSCCAQRWRCQHDPDCNTCAAPHLPSYLFNSRHAIRSFSHTDLHTSNASSVLLHLGNAK